MTTADHIGETATVNFANSMREALSGVVAPEPTTAIAPPEPVKAPETPPEPQKPATVVPEPVKTTPEPAKSPEPTKATEEPEDEKWPRTAQEWKKWNQVRRDEYGKRDKEIEKWKGEATALQAKIKEVGTPSQHPEYESVKKERDQFSEVLKTIAVENHPKFKDYYDGKVTSQVDLAKRIAGPEKAELMARALSLPDGDFRDRQIEELVSDLPTLKQSQIAGVLNNLNQIQSERQVEITNARANFDKLQKEQAEAGKQVRVQLEAKFNDTVQRLQSKEGNPLYQLKTGDEGWNRAVNERVEVAKHFLLGNPKPEQIIEAAANAAAYPALIEHQIALSKENETLKAQIKTLSTATPTVSGDRKAPEGGNEPKPLLSSSRPMEAAQAFFKNLPQLGS